MKEHVFVTIRVTRDQVSCIRAESDVAAAGRNLW